MKALKKQFDTKLIYTSLVFAFIYSVLFNSSVLLYKYSHYKAPFFSVLFDLSLQLIGAYFVVFIVFLGLAINRSIFIVGSAFLFLTGAIASYYLFRFGIAPTLKTMPTIYSTATKNIPSWLNIKLALWMIFSLIICFFSIKHFNPQPTKSFVTKVVAVLCLFLTVNNIISPQFKALRTYFPNQYLSNTYRYFFATHNSSKKNTTKQKSTNNNQKNITKNSKNINH